MSADLLVSETAPLASSRGVLVSLIKLNILNGVTKATLINTSAAGNVAVNLHDRKVIDKLLSIGQVSLFGHLRQTAIPVLVIESVSSESKHSHVESGESNAGGHDTGEGAASHKASRGAAVQVCLSSDVHYYL